MRKQNYELIIDLNTFEFSVEPNRSIFGCVSFPTAECKRCASVSIESGIVSASASGFSLQAKTEFQSHVQNGTRSEVSSSSRFG